MKRHARLLGPVQLIRSDDGAFDLKSNIVAAVLGALFISVIGVVLFGLLPWSWDNAAKSDLEAVKTAEGVSITREGRYFDGDTLLDKKFLNAATDSDVETTTNKKGTCFAAVAESKSGKTFFIADWLDNAQEVTPAIRFVDGCAEQIVPDVMSWGYGASGRLGTGTFLNSSKAVPVKLDAEDDIYSVSAGGSHSCAATQFEAWCWGQGGSGQLGDGRSSSSNTPVKVKLPEGEITSISTGRSHTCAAVAGDIYCWGYSYYGQTGFDGPRYTNRAIPTKVEGLPDSAKVTVTAGGDHTCAIADGDVWCWGYNNNGQLGDGTVETRRTPVKVGALTLTSGATEVAAGESHTCAVVGDDAWCWGRGGSGELGSGNTSSQRSPVKVQGLPGAVTSIEPSDAGNYSGAHTCAVSAGEAWCWGSNSRGQLATDGITYSPRPLKVGGALAGRTIDFIGTGSGSSCASSANTVWCWGENTVGQAGNGTLDSSSTPRKVAGLIGKEPVTGISVGSSHVLAAMGGAGFAPGAPIDRPYKFPVSGFGSGAYGQIGTGGVASSSVATPADWKPGTRVYSPTAGSSHSCALTDNEAWCWGYNGNGQLGDGTATNRLTPVKVQGLPDGTISSIQAGSGHVCAVIEEEAWCWGNGTSGQLGHGKATSSSIPVKVSGLTGVTAITAGTLFTCAVADGTGYCWGSGENYRTGTGSTVNVNAPTPVYGIPLGKKVQSISAGSTHACAIVGEAADVWCWGSGNRGQLGNGMGSAVSPVKVQLPAAAASITAGDSHTCAVVGATFDLYCWGYNTSGQIGVGTTTSQVAAPTPVPGMSGVSSVTAGTSHTCALTSVLYCWGAASSGQIGNGGTVESNTPALVTGLPAGEPVTGIAAGGSHTIAVIDGIPMPALPEVQDEEADYPLKSWGLNTSGQLASGTMNNSLIPMDVDWLPESPVTELQSGSEHTCAVTGEDVYCWGYNSYGQIGDGTTTNRRSPVKVTGLPGGQPYSLQAAGSRSCVLIGEDAWCWGFAGSGLVGDGSTGNRTTPARIQGLPGSATSIGVGGSHACAVSEGNVWCWGNGSDYKLGNGAVANSAVPVKVTGIPAGKKASAVVSGTRHSCAIIGEAAELYCWGHSDGGLGNGYTTAQSAAKVTGLAGVTSASAGSNFTCAVSSGEPWCWGYNTDGQTGTGLGTSVWEPKKVAGLEGESVLGVYTGGTHACAITASQSAWCWGDNGSGQLGSGTTVNGMTASKMTVEGVTAIAPGNSHTVAASGVFTADRVPAVKDEPVGDYPMRAWGANSYGKLGTGSFLAGQTPQIVDWNPESDITRTAAGANHSCAIEGKSVWCWGSNNSGQLGNGTTAESSKPVRVSGLPSGQPSGLQAQGSQTCVVVGSEAWCWGSNNSGQLGDGTKTNAKLPVKVNVPGTVTSVSIGSSHACAVSDLKAWCWGNGSNNKLGNASTDSSVTPVEVSGFPLGKGVSGVAAGSDHTCAVVGQDAEVYCWGFSNGGLGNGGNSSITPVKATGLSAVTALKAGNSLTCAISNGTPWCWGYNPYGQIGDGSSSHAYTPSRVNWAGTAVDLSVGTDSSCMLSSIGEAWCWGNGANYKMGNAATGNYRTPVLVSGMETDQPVTSIAVGAEHVIAKTGGSPTPEVLPKLVDKKIVMPLNAWGSNTSYQLGTGNNTSSNIPALVNWEPGAKVSQVIAGESSSCALVEGEPWCWGNGANGRLGTGDISNQTLPVKAAKTWTGKVIKLHLMKASVCALTDNGEVWCWGSGTNAQLGDGNRSDRSTAVKVNLPAPASSVSIGTEHACAVTAGGDLYCWGYNTRSKVAPGTAETAYLKPTLVTGFPAGKTRVAAVSVGEAYTCAVIGEAAETYCWGYNSAGFGAGQSLTTWPSPTGLTGIKLIESGLNHTCAVNDAGLHCFGLNNTGQLGLGTTVNQASPQQVPGMNGKAITALSLGSNTTCAITGDGTSWCWGLNTSGQLGDGTTVSASAPKQVTGLKTPGPVTSIAAGNTHTVAVVDGIFQSTAYPAVKDEPVDQYPLNSWGGNSFFQLAAGNGFSTTTPTPTLWEPGAKTSQVVAGENSSCALVEGEPWCWGNGANGRLGNSAGDTKVLPVKVTKTWTGKVAKLHLMKASVCALTDNGEVWCWGAGTNAQLGDGNRSDRSTAVKVNLPAPASSVSIGTEHACAVTAGGDLYCWGYNTRSKVAPGAAETAYLKPTLVTGFPVGKTRVSAVSVGEAYTCAVIGAAAETYCWGYNSAGFGVGQSLMTWPSPTGLTGIKLIESGLNHTCAVNDAGLHCFGSNNTGQLGLGTITTGQTRPQQVPGMNGKAITALSLGSNTTCAITGDGTPWCWGSNTSGQLGDGTTVHASAPKQVTGLKTPGPVTSIAAGTSHTLAVIDGIFKPTAYPEVKDEPVDQYPLNAWGANGSYQLGSGNYFSSTTPTPTLWEPGAKVNQVVAGENSSCALVEGEPWCWGNGANGRLGNSASDTKILPVQVTKAWTGNIVKLHLMKASVCALTDSGEVWCWGDSYNAQLGDATDRYSNGRSRAIQVILPAPATSVSIGTAHGCAVIEGGDLYCWGSNENSRVAPGVGNYHLKPTLVTGFPVGKTRVSAVTVADKYTCAVIGAAAEAYCWGTNDQGLGNGGTYSTWPSPTGLTGIKLIESGLNHTCAVNDAGLHCFGTGSTGQLGLGNTTSHTRPQQVSGMNGKTVTALSLGSNTTCAITGDGTPWCWGYNTSGQLGDGTTVNAYAPKQVTGLKTPGPVTSIAAGTTHTVAVVDGIFQSTAYPEVKDEPVDQYPLNAWGANGSHQLASGNGLSTTTPTPTLWEPGAKASQVVAGENSSCALVEGEPWCWGNGDNGRLGNSAVNTQMLPVQVTKAWTGNIVKLHLMKASVCALTDSGEVWCWGDSYNAQLGEVTDRYSNGRSRAIQVILPAPATSVSIGTAHGCAVIEGGDLYCWGSNENSRVAPGVGNYYLKPTLVTGFPVGKTRVSAVTVADKYTCAVVGAVAEAYCWGTSDQGLGNGGKSSTWPAPTGLTGIKLIESGLNHTCAVNGAGLHCFGTGSSGQLGLGNTTSHTRPQQVPGMSGKTVTALSLGSITTCAITGDGTPWCWGSNTSGQLGDGTTVHASAPKQVTGLKTPGPVTSIAAGNTHTLAVIDGIFKPTAYPEVKDEPTDRNLVNGWGLNSGYQLGSYDTGFFAKPAPANWTPERVNALSTSSGHSCAIDDTDLYCWGSTANGKLGIAGTTGSQPAPALVGAGYTDVDTGIEHTCGIKEGSVWCWGYNYNGQLGDNTTNTKTMPVKTVMTGKATAITTRGSHTCAALEGGTAACWGYNSSGQLGDGTTVERRTAVTVPGLTGVTALSSGSSHTCAIADGRVKCWGLNTSGKALGSGSGNVLKPTIVPGLSGTATSVSSGTSNTCAVIDGSVWCWGDSSKGAMGEASGSAPVKINVPGTVTKVETGQDAACALTDDGAAWCWGVGTSGQLGDGKSADSKVPVRVAVPEGRAVRLISLGTTHALAALTPVQ